MPVNRKIQVGNLEFDEIKANLKEFLRGQDAFSDYDFEGSNMSVLLDVLAYNTYYNNVYQNMALNECFLDTASKRESVVSRATELGYVPRSHRCASTRISFRVTGVSNNPERITMPKYTTFTGTRNQKRFTFYTTSDITTTRDSNNEYQFTDVLITEGAPVDNRFVYSSDSGSYVIPNNTIDTTTLIVKVQTPPDTTYEVFTNVSNWANIDGESACYFLREVEGGQYKISFGDGIIGKEIPNGAIVYMTYFVSSGEEPNGIYSISFGGRYLEGGSVTNIVMSGTVEGGRLPETIDEIRFNAPNFYASQNRIVTALDYETLILNKVPAIEAVTVWGGETNEPPIYGKVFISAKTVSGRDLTYADQQTIIDDVIENYKIATVIPEFVHPEYINIELDVVVYYDKTITTKSADDIRTQIIANLLQYDEVQLQKFNRIMRGSVISRMVEETDLSIISAIPRTKIHRTVSPIYNTISNYIVNIGNPFTANSIITTPFYIMGNDYAHYIDDNGSGILRLYRVINGKRVDISNIGTVDYANGVLYVYNLAIRRIEGIIWQFSITPSSSDIVSILNQIVQLDRANLKVSMIADESTRGRVLKGTKYQFTPSTI